MKDKIYKYFTRLSAFIVCASILFLIGYILVMGLPHIKPSLFALQYTSENVSLMPSLITTIMLIAFSLALALPIGIFTAIYMEEYAKKTSKVKRLLSLAVETLSGIPSIIYGLFGLLFFVTKLSFSYSLLSGGLTMTILILPFIIRSTQEALNDVPTSYRDAAVALGASKLYIIFKVVIPSAMSGILSGIILSIGRIVGESAALIYTLGSVAKIPESFLSSGRTLAVHMWALSSEGFHSDEAFATAVVLLVLVLFMNMLSHAITKKFTKGNAYEA